MGVSRVNHDEFNHPWLVAVWPGMGHVAVKAGYYLMSKLGMYQVAEFSAQELFDIEHIEVRDGLIRSGRLPRSRFYLWSDPEKRRDLVVFLGEAQPPLGKNAFCRQLVHYAREIGVERIFTFAAMATSMDLSQRSRVFAAATDVEMLQDLSVSDVEVLKEGRISGLNGVLLGVAAEEGMRGACLLGEMPHIFSQIPFPKAAQSVLEVFGALAGIDVDLKDLMKEASEMNSRLGEVLSRMEEAMRHRQSDATKLGEDRPSGDVGPESARLSEENLQKIEELFVAAKMDRAKAYDLKQELDRLGVFPEFEDRFLDLFKDPPKPGEGGKIPR